MTSIETKALTLAALIKQDRYSEAAYALVRIPNNGRRSLVQLRTERNLTEMQTLLWAQCVGRFAPDEDVMQEPLS